MQVSCLKRKPNMMAGAQGHTLEVGGRYLKILLDKYTDTTKVEHTLSCTWPSKISTVPWDSQLSRLADNFRDPQTLYMISIKQQNKTTFGWIGKYTCERLTVVSVVRLAQNKTFVHVIGLHKVNQDTVSPQRVLWYSIRSTTRAQSLAEAGQNKTLVETSYPAYTSRENKTCNICLQSVKTSCCFFCSMPFSLYHCENI